MKLRRRACGQIVQAVHNACTRRARSSLLPSRPIKPWSSDDGGSVTAESRTVCTADAAARGPALDQRASDDLPVTCLPPLLEHEAADPVTPDELQTRAVYRARPRRHEASAGGRAMKEEGRALLPGARPLLLQAEEADEVTLLVFGHAVDDALAWRLLDEPGMVMLAAGAAHGLAPGRSGSPSELRSGGGLVANEAA
eukprot:scaffold93099_cov66-Phaeocystis_antarctica.AAC.4